LTDRTNRELDLYQQATYAISDRVTQPNYMYVYEGVFIKYIVSTGDDKKRTQKLKVHIEMLCYLTHMSSLYK